MMALGQEFQWVEALVGLVRAAGSSRPRIVARPIQLCGYEAGDGEQLSLLIEGERFLTVEMYRQRRDAQY